MPANTPNKWIPVYSRVTFSNQPYLEALEAGDFQEEIMKEIMQIPDIEQNWDSEIVENRILELLLQEKNA